MKNRILIVASCFVLLLLFPGAKSSPPVSSYESGSGISITEVSAVQNENLVKLCRIWGFLKYYHPAVRSGKLDWDAKLFDILPKVLACNSPAEGNVLLAGWISPLASVKFPKEKKDKQDTSSVKMRAELGWIADTVMLGKEISAQLVAVYKMPRGKKNFYAGKTPVGNPDFSNEKAYAQFAFPDAGYRLLALFRYWNIIEYGYPYRYAMGEDWPGVLRDYIPRFTGAADAQAYQLCLLSLVGHIHDSHAKISANDHVLADYYGRNIAPAEISMVEGMPVVTGFPSDSAEKSSGLKKGDVLLSVNEKSPETLLMERMPLIPSSNREAKMRDFAFNLLRTNDTAISLTINRDNQVQKLSVHCYPYTEKTILHRFQRNDTCFRYLTPEISYIYAGSIRNNYLQDVMPGMMNTKAMIIDLRCYPSEFIPFTLGKYLRPSAAPFVKFTSMSLSHPGNFYFHPVYAGNGKNSSSCYKGKLIILVNELTQSQAEYTAMAFRAVPGAVVVGSTTAGADGDVSTLALPGNVFTRISGMGIYWPDGRETQRTGIIPDIRVSTTIGGIREGKDEVLEKAIEIANKK